VALSLRLAWSCLDIVVPSMGGDGIDAYLPEGRRSTLAMLPTVYVHLVQLVREKLSLLFSETVHERRHAPVAMARTPSYSINNIKLNRLPDCF
jgi:hypothetical protein